MDVNELLNVAVTDGYWDYVHMFLTENKGNPDKIKLRPDNVNRAVIEWSRLIEEKDFERLILPHCVKDNVDDILKTLVSRGFWYATMTVLQHSDVSQPMLLWVRSEAQKRSDTESFLMFIQPYCLDDDEDSTMTQSLQGETFEVEQSLISDQTFPCNSEEDLTLSNEQSERTASAQRQESCGDRSECTSFRERNLHCENDNAVFYHGSSDLYGSSADYKNKLQDAIGQGDWNMVDHVLSINRENYLVPRLSTEEIKNAVNEGSKRASDEEFERYLVHHCSPDTLDIVLPAVVSRAMWFSIGKLLQQNATSTDVQALILQAAIETADDDIFNNFILPFCTDYQTTENNTAAVDTQTQTQSVHVSAEIGCGLPDGTESNINTKLAHAFDQSDFEQVESLLYKNSHSNVVHEEILYVRQQENTVQAEINAAGSQTNTDFSVLLCDAAREQNWQLVGELLDLNKEKKFVTVGRKEYVHVCTAFHDGSKHADEISFETHLLRHCDVPQTLSDVLKILASKGFWFAVGSVLQQHQVDSPTKEWVLQHALENADPDSFLNFIKPHFEDEHVLEDTDQSEDSSWKNSTEDLLRLGQNLDFSESEELSSYDGSSESDEVDYSEPEPDSDRDFVCPGDLERLQDHLTKASDKKNSWEIYVTCFPHLKKLEPILPLVMEQDVSADQYIEIFQYMTNEFSEKSVGNTLLTKLHDSRQEHMTIIMRVLIRRGWWRSVNKLIRNKKCNSDLVDEAIFQTSRQGSEKSFLRYILPLCKPRHMDSVITELANRGCWKAVGKLLTKVKADKSCWAIRNWAVSCAVQKASEKSFSAHIFPHCKHSTEKERDVTVKQLVHTGKLKCAKMLEQCAHASAQIGDLECTIQEKKEAAHEYFVDFKTAECKIRSTAFYIWHKHLSKLISEVLDCMKHDKFLLSRHEVDRVFDTREVDNFIRGILSSVNMKTNKALKCLEGKDVTYLHGCVTAFEFIVFEKLLSIYRYTDRNSNTDWCLLVLLATLPLYPSIQSMALRILMENSQWSVISKARLSHAFEDVRTDLLYIAVTKRKWNLVEQWADHSVYDDQRCRLVTEAFKRKKFSVYMLLADYGLTRREQLYAHFRLAKHANRDTLRQAFERGADIAEMVDLLEIRSNMADLFDKLSVMAILLKKDSNMADILETLSDMVDLPKEHCDMAKILKTIRDMADLFEKHSTMADFLKELSAMTKFLKKDGTMDDFLKELSDMSDFLMKHGNMADFLKKHSDISKVPEQQRDMVKILKNLSQMSKTEEEIRILRRCINLRKRENRLFGNRTEFDDALNKQLWCVVLYELQNRHSDEKVRKALQAAKESGVWHVVRYTATMLPTITERDALFLEMMDLKQWGICRVLLEHRITQEVCLNALPLITKAHQWVLIGIIVQEYDIGEALTERILQIALEKREGSVACICMQALHKNLSEKERNSLFKHALRFNIWQLVKYLVHKRDIIGCAHRDKALKKAISTHRWDVVDYCLLHGGDLDSTDKAGGTAVMKSAAIEDWESVRELTTRGADLTKGYSAYVALFASLTKRWKTARLLIQYFAKLDACMLQGSALHLLINAREVDLMDESLFWGQDITRGTNLKHETVLHAVCAAGVQGSMYFHIARGADPLAVTQSGKSVLMYAVQSNRNVKMIEECISLGMCTFQPTITAKLAKAVQRTMMAMIKILSFEINGDEEDYYENKQTLRQYTNTCPFYAVARAAVKQEAGHESKYLMILKMLYESGACSYLDCHVLSLLCTVLSLEEELNSSALDYLQGIVNSPRSLRSMCRILISHQVTGHRWKPRKDISKLVLDHFQNKNSKKPLTEMDREAMIPMRDYLLFVDLTGADPGDGEESRVENTAMAENAIQDGESSSFFDVLINEDLMSDVESLGNLEWDSLRVALDVISDQSSDDSSLHLHSFGAEEENQGQRQKAQGDTEENTEYCDNEEDEEQWDGDDENENDGDDHK